MNQHEAICGGNPFTDTDPVTGVVHPVCTCGAPKYFNHDPPVRADGKSTQCQMNKFDDMMAIVPAVAAFYASDGEGFISLHPRVTYRLYV